MRIVFIGSPEFAVPILKTLAQKYPISGVVTQPDRPAGRGRKLVPPPVKITAVSLGIPVLQPEKIRESEAMLQIETWAPDMIIVAAYGQILRQNLLDLPRYGCLNVHASLLPRWRGAAPIQAAIMAGDSLTGITIMMMDAGMDTGPILSQFELAITPEDTCGSLSTRLAQIGAQLLMKTLPEYLHGKLLPKKQSQEGVTFAPMLKKEDGLLDFSQPARILERRVRALNPWPGAFFIWKNLSIKIHTAHYTNNKSPFIGAHLNLGGLPAIGTSNGCLILDQLQPSGKKTMSGKAFIAGARDWME